MLRFASPNWLYVLVLLAVCAVAVLVQWRALSRRRARLADDFLLDELTGGRSFRFRKTRWLLGLGALALWVVALANPQWGTRERVAAVQSTEVVLALDISESMLTEDVRPNRLSRAQNFLLDVIDALDGEQVGLILFAGQAYVQVPLTTDYAALKLLIRSAGPAQAPTQGTNFSAAVNLARQLLRPEEGELTSVRRLLVMVSDGENHEELAEEALADAEREGLRLLTVGVGTEEGARIPARGGGRNAYKRGPQGEPVVSKFDPAALQALAAAGRGQYFDLSANALAVAQRVAQVIESGPTTTTGEEVFRESASYYQLFLLLGFVLWIAAWLVGRELRTDNVLEQPGEFGHSAIEIEHESTKAQVIMSGR